MSAISGDLKRTFLITLVVLATALGVYALIKVINLLFLVFLALLISIFLSFFVNFFAEKLKIPRGVALAISLVLLLSVVVLFVVTLVPVVISQGQRALEQLPALAVKLQEMINSFLSKIGSDMYVEVDELIRNAVSKGGAFLSRGIFAAVGKGVYVAMEIFVLIVVAIYFSLSRIDDPTPIAKFFPPASREKISWVYVNIIKKLRAWLMGQLFSMTVIAFLYSVGLTIIGVPYSLFFGILAGALCFVPYIGPPASTVGPLLFALAESPIKGVWVLVLYAASQTLESYFLTPLVMRHQVKLHPIVTIVSIMAMGQLFGVLGVAVAVPTVAVGQFLFEEIFVKSVAK
ncbi:MAG TPA: AI-2E family transporter [candidate division Zixibacteria bacterium]|nr:AI-2E family transporter [candidate division Zixibacteria bacterium]